MRSYLLRSSGATVAFAAACAVLLALIAGADALEKATFVLERRVGITAPWVAGSTFVVSYHDASSQPKLKVLTKSVIVELSREEKIALSNATHVLYRVRRDGTQADAPLDRSDVLASVAASPCTLIRGFDAKDSKTLQITESVKVHAGYAEVGSSSPIFISGVQLSSSTNTFHAKMSRGNQCDLSVLTLFPVVTLRSELGLLRPTPLRVVPDYSELRELRPKADREAAAETREREKAEGGAEREDGKPQEEKTFFEKYGTIILITIGFSLVRSLLSGR